MDEVSARAVREAFLRLYRKGLAYRAEALVNWCPGCRTSVSDLEVLPTPETGTLWSVRYHLVDEATGAADPGPDDHRGDDAPRDDPGRHGGGRAPGRPALRRPHRPDGPHPVRGARRAGDRGPRRGDGVRDRRREDHAGPRPRRQRDRQAPRPRDADDPRRRAPASRTPARPYDGLDRYAARTAILADLAARGDLEGEKAHEMVIGKCQRVRRRRGAAAQDPVVRAHRAARRGRPGRDARWPHPDPPGALREGLGALDDHDPRLEREPPAVVGPPDPGLVLPGRPRDGERRDRRARRPARPAAARRRSSSRTRTSSTPGSAPACGRSPRWAGRTRPRTCAGSTRARSWRPATTSSSSGSPG